ncbi:type II toxin-antitoxin system VapC family toxin [Arthrospira platensis SPKY1]|nr:type II toxin-antitoxin system VapC family toxin [Arthrospira platensis SPKY1]
MRARDGAFVQERGKRVQNRCKRFGHRHGLGREDFQVDMRLPRRGLLDNSYGELPVGSEHAVALDGLPPLHKDPFDRLLPAQALVEGITLLTSDAVVA